MNRKIIFGFILIILAVMNSRAQSALAFPGAEGFGKYTTGGRGGLVIKVTNLNDAGPGSFREAAETNKPRIIVFDVSGTIRLEKRVFLKSNATILGQTAPGDGICIADKSVQLNGDNIIIRYMRFRLGDRYQRLDGMVDGSGGEDAFSGSRKKNILIDHCSFSWSNDEAISVYAGDSTTIQWCMISEPLNYSYHFEKGDTDWEHHGYGGIWGGKHFTAHHNLFAHCKNRNPRFDGIRNSETELVDFRNNVIYNWGENSVYAGEGGHYNMVNNYYKSGENTKKSVRSNIVSPGNRLPEIPFGKFYVNGNITEGFPSVSSNNWNGVNMGNNGTEEDKRSTVIDQPHVVDDIQMEAAESAFERVLTYAGASYSRDTLDQRIVEDVKKGRGRIIDVQGGFEHGIAFEKTLGAWPLLKVLPAQPDSDMDGMPDQWEQGHHLDIKSNDANKNTLHAIYTNIEVYANELLEKIGKK